MGILIDSIVLRKGARAHRDHDGQGEGEWTLIGVPSRTVNITTTLADQHNIYMTINQSFRSPRAFVFVALLSICRFADEPAQMRMTDREAKLIGRAKEKCLSDG